MPVAVHQTIRTRRKSVCLEITETGLLVVRAPHSVSERSILSFLEKKSDWIERKVRQAIGRAKTALPACTRDEEKRLRSLARDAFIERACIYARKMGVNFQSIRLSSARTRWGSCGTQGTLSFNWKLIRAPADVLDYVVIHELSHLAEHNHSPRFWAKVAEHCPDYRKARSWLKENRL